MTVTLAATSCVQPRSAEQLAEERKKEQAKVQEVLKRIAAWKESALSPAELYAAYEHDEAKASRILTNRQIAVKGRVKNIRWEKDVPVVSFFVRDGALGSVSCATTESGGSIQDIRDLDYTRDLYMVGKVTTGMVMPWIGKGEKFIMIVLEDCMVLW